MIRLLFSIVSHSMLWANTLDVVYCLCFNRICTVVWDYISILAAKITHSHTFLQAKTPDGSWDRLADAAGVTFFPLLCFVIVFLLDLSLDLAHPWAIIAKDCWHWHLSLVKSPPIQFFTISFKPGVGIDAIDGFYVDAFKSKNNWEKIKEKFMFSAVSSKTTSQTHFGKCKCIHIYFRLTNFANS